MTGNKSVKVLFSCSSVGITNRGIESFFREAFDGLKHSARLEALLIKGGGKSFQDEKVVWCLAKTSRLAAFIGRVVGRSSYVVEQWSSFPGVVLAIRKFRPHVVFTSDANLMFLLRRFRRQIGVPFRVLYSNGGPVHPPFNRHDCVHQVAPFYLHEALEAGEPPEKHFLVPYGIHVPSAPVYDVAAKRALRQQLGLPLDRPIVLSVGWIARQHKRMDYVIEEVARMAEPRPYLQMLGAMDEASPEIIDLANRLLGPDHFSARSVPYQQVADYYRAADCFVLGSLKEGFGRVYLEALMHGLPTIGHRHPVIEWVLGGAGIVADLSQPGGLATVLAEQLAIPADLQKAQSHQRWESVRSRFDWEVLRDSYAAMFRACATQVMPVAPGAPAPTSSRMP